MFASFVVSIWIKLLNLMKDNSLVPSNEIWYTSVDDKPIDLPRSTQDMIVSNTYNDGKGVIVFKNEVVEIKGSAFEGCIGCAR